ncbi:MAG: AzlC family ABC transporter permease, partial [Pseudomonadota bacterium]
VMLVASDANWAMSMQAFSREKPGFGILLGGGLALWLFWVIGTWLGIYFGNVVSDPKRFGLDMVMGCFLLTMVVNGEKNLRMLFIWSVAAIASLLAYRFLPENSHIIVGALAGGLAGLTWGYQANAR